MINIKKICLINSPEKTVKSPSEYVVEYRVYERIYG